jgi:hypothetical protein
MKTPQRKQNHVNYKTITQRYELQSIVETQTFALQNEHQLPPIRAIWRVIDSKSGEENIGDRRKEP